MLEQKIVHIGLHKTGTTFLQRQVFPYINKDIISDEALSGNPINSGNYGLEIRNILINGIKTVYGSNVKIILGVRDKDRWVHSCFNQYVKGGRGGFYNFDKWFDKVFDKRLLDFDSYVSFINNNFNNVFVYNFEDFIRDKSKVVNELLDFIDVDDNTRDLVFSNMSSKVYNKRLGRFGILFFRFLNFIREGYKYVINFGRI